MSDQFTKSLAEPIAVPSDGTESLEATSAPNEAHHDSKRLRKNIAALSVLQLLNYALPLVVVPYLTRVLGPAQYGLLIFAQATVNYANAITDYGFNFSATRLIARNREDTNAISSVFWSTMIAKALLMLVCLLVLMVLIGVVPMFRSEGSLLLATFIMVIGGVLFPTWFFQGIEAMRSITITQAAAKLLLIPLIFVFVTRPEHVVRAAAIQGGVFMMAGLVAIPFVRRTKLVHWHRPTLNEMKDTFVGSWHLFLSSVSILVYTSTNAVILGFLSGPVQTGYFGAANRAVQASNGLLIPVTQALYPHLNSMAVKSRASAVALIRKSVLWISLVACAVAVGFFIAAGPISHILFGRRFDGSIQPLRWMAALPILIGLSNVFGIQTMLTFGMNKEFNRIVSGSVAVNLVLTIPFAHFWGANGAAAALLITECFVTVATFLVVRSSGLLSRTPEARQGVA